MDRTVRKARSRGYLISYEKTGSGPAVLLVPGWLQDATDWRTTGPASIPAAMYVDHLGKSYLVITVDPLSHGLSDKPHDSSAYRLPDVAADLIAPLDAEGIEKAVLWGYSWGAFLAAVAASEFPGRVSALIVGANPLTHKGWSRDWIEPLAQGDWNLFWKTNTWPFAIDRAWAEDNDPLALAAQMEGETQSIATSRYRLDVARISSPSLLYCGGDDSPEQMEPTAKTLHAKLHVIEGLNHPQTFKASERLLAIVLPFIAAHS